MTIISTTDYFMSVLKENHTGLISALKNLGNSLVAENSQSKDAQAKNTLVSLKNLKSIILKKNIPVWLTNLEKEIANFIRKNDNPNAANINNFLFRNFNEIENHQWNFDAEEDKSFDFDSIFERHKAASNLPILFDKIIKNLEDIYNTREVDSRTMLKGLEKVIATIKKSKDGSYFSLNSGWEFMLNFIKNYMWKELGNLPVFGSMFEALEQTIKETEKEMFKVHVAINDELESTVGGEIKALENHAKFNFMTYNRSAVQIPTLSNTSSIKLEA